MYRKTFVEVNIDSLKENVSNIIKKYNNYKYLDIERYLLLL